MARADRELPVWLSGGLVAATFVVLLGLETRRPLRRATASRRERIVRNLAMAAESALAVRLTERPVTRRLTALVERRRWGIAKRLALPRALEVPLAIVLLDYTLFVWHVLTHKVPALWRLHAIHHADPDLDASTALRFAAAEMIVSVPWRAAQVVTIGPSPLALSAWQTLTLVAILFHHSNVRLPLAVERRLCRVVVTPRLHGIHHSDVREETDSNWGTILALPDRLHGTLRLEPPQDAIRIGLPVLATRPRPDRARSGRSRPASSAAAGAGAPPSARSAPHAAERSRRS